MTISEKQLRKLLAIGNVRAAVAEDLGVDEDQVGKLTQAETRSIVEHADCWFANYTDLALVYAPQDDYEPNPIHIYGSRGIYCVTVVGSPPKYFDTLEAARKYGNEQISQFFVDGI